MVSGSWSQASVSTPINSDCTCVFELDPLRPGRRLSDTTHQRQAFDIGGATVSMILVALIGGALTLGVLGLSWDLSREPSDQWSAAFLLGAIDLYQVAGSPVLEHAGVRCRFQPTCSHYAAEVISMRGALVGVWKTASRVARCGPWTPEGTLDPP
jgi:putative membrane protein insertion efficiency factor